MSSRVSKTGAVVLSLSLLLNAFLLWKFKSDLRSLFSSEPQPLAESRLTHIAPDGTIRILNSEEQKTGNILPEDSLFLANGSVYQFPNGKCYSLKIPGLYRFFNGTQNRQVLVGGQTLTPVELAKMLSWTVVHGDKDNKNWKNWKTTLTKREMTLTCGYITRVAKDWFDYFHIPNRIINLKTQEPLNGYDDAHVMIECFDNSKQSWQLFDPDNNSYFIDSLNKPLNLSSFIVNLYSNQLNTAELAGDPDVDISGFQPYSFATTAMYTQEGMIRWYQRVCQSIQSDFYTGNLVLMQNGNSILDSSLVKKLETALYAKP